MYTCELILEVGRRSLKQEKTFWSVDFCLLREKDKSDTIDFLTRTLYQISFMDSQDCHFYELLKISEKINLYNIMSGNPVDESILPIGRAYAMM